MASLHARQCLCRSCFFATCVRDVPELRAWERWVHLKGSVARLSARKLRGISKELTATNQKVGLVLDMLRIPRHREGDAKGSAAVTIRLSKSKFVAGCQCLKRLYLQVHEPELAAEPEDATDAIIQQGREVGLLARKLFPGGVEVHSDKLDQAIRATRELIANREGSAIFEGTFEHGGVLVRVDILHRRRDGRWRLIALSRPGNLSLAAQAQEEDLGSVGDEYCQSHSECLREAAKVAEKQAHDARRVQQFENFVWRNSPRLLPVLRAIEATRNYTKAAALLGLTASEFSRMRHRLIWLGRYFVSGEPVPKQRKPYKRRSESTACGLVG